ncbi:hypothetical protein CAUPRSCDRAFT_11284, partial [Caulochytrium protostelioides]
MMSPVDETAMTVARHAPKQRRSGRRDHLNRRAPTDRPTRSFSEKSIGTRFMITVISVSFLMSLTMWQPVAAHEGHHASLSSLGLIPEATSSKHGASHATKGGTIGLEPPPPPASLSYMTYLFLSNDQEPAHRDHGDNDRQADPDGLKDEAKSRERRRQREGRAVARFALLSHIFLMLLAWVVLLPLAVLRAVYLRLPASLQRMGATMPSAWAVGMPPHYLLALAGVMAHALGVMVLHVLPFGANTPNLYPHAAHARLGWFMTWLVAAQAMLGIWRKICRMRSASSSSGATLTSPTRASSMLGGSDGRQYHYGRVASQRGDDATAVDAHAEHELLFNDVPESLATAHAARHDHSRHDGLASAHAVLSAQTTIPRRPSSVSTTSSTGYTLNGDRHHCLPSIVPPASNVFAPSHSDSCDMNVDVDAEHKEPAGMDINYEKEYLVDSDLKSTDDEWASMPYLSTAAALSAPLRYAILMLYRVAMTLGRSATWIHTTLLGRYLLLPCLAPLQIILGWVTLMGWFQGIEKFNGLAHWIKGGVFMLVGAASLTRWFSRGRWGYQVAWLDVDFPSPGSPGSTTTAAATRPRSVATPKNLVSVP